MGRYTNENYVKITRDIMKSGLSNKAILLFLWLNELEQRFTSERNFDQRDWFMHTDREISEKSGMSINTVKSAKKELKEKGFIEISRGGWHYTKTGKSGIKQPTVYRIIR